MPASSKFEFKVDGVSSGLFVASFEAVEGMSSLFEVEVTLASEDPAVAPSEVVGQPALLTIEAGADTPRYFHGIVSRFRQAETGKKLAVYHATVVPKLWRLRQRHDSRIFQDQTAPEIVEKVLKGAGLASGTDYRLALQATYMKREYCVQYRESDFAFVSRLLEEEGIFYFFEHGEGKHVLVLGDKPSANAPIQGDANVPYHGQLGAMSFKEHVQRFSYAEEVRTGKVTLRDWDFKKPSLSLLSTSSGSKDTDLEAYDYPGEYEVPGDGDAYAKVRLEEQRARSALAAGTSNCFRLTAGYCFTLAEHPRDAANAELLLTAVRHRGTEPTLGESGSDVASYENDFLAILAKVPFRPERVTPRPTLKGVQTAIVTGPGGEEIYVDEHGRVKVQFHWDRLGKKDDKSSCWIRVSQLWAGAGWGAMWIPRIGHEVIVDFLEGDPDRPIIVGRVYHGANVPPYALPAEKTKSTIKSNSSQGGDGSNELRFEDKKGQEEIWLHGQKDWNIKIEHDKNQLVGHDETKKVDHDESYEIGHDQKLQVDNDRTKVVKHDQKETVGHDKTIDVGNDHTESIGNNEKQTISANATRSVTSNQDVSVGKDSTLGVGGSHSLTVGKDLTIEAGGGLNESFGKDATSSVGGAMSTTVAKDYALTVSGAGSAQISKDLEEKIDGSHNLTVGKKFVLQVGDGTITVEKDGTVTIKGKDITVQGTGKINVQGSSKVTVKSDGPVNVEASGAVKIKGSNVDVN